MAGFDINSLLGTVDQGLNSMTALLKSNTPGIQAGIANVQGGAGQIAASAEAVKAVTQEHIAAVAAGEQSANTLATKKTELEQILLEEKFASDQKFKPKFDAAVSAMGNEEGMQRIKQYQQKTVKVQQNLEDNIQKSNANPIASLFDGTLQALQTGRATQEQLAKGLSMEVATQDLAEKRLNSMLSNEENSRKFMSERNFQKSKELSTANLLHVKAINRQKVTESDIADLTAIYNMDKDQVSAMTTALNASMSLMNQGLNVAQSVVQGQMVKMQLAGMAQTYTKDEERTQYLQQMSDMAKTLGFNLPITKLRNPETLTTEEQGLFLTIQNRMSFGTGSKDPKTYDQLTASAAYDTDKRYKKMAVDTLWRDAEVGKIHERLAVKDIPINERMELEKKLNALPQTPVTPMDKQTALELYGETTKDIETKDAAPVIQRNMFALTSPLATNSDGSTVSFKDLTNNGALVLKNPDLMDTLGVNWNLTGANASKAIETQFDTIATGLISAAKRKDGFNLTEATIQQTADDLARVYKFQIATASSNPNFPFHPKTLAFKGVDLGNGESRMFGGYDTIPSTLDITNPQSLQVMLQNRVQRRMTEAAQAAQADKAAGSVLSIGMGGGAAKDLAGW